MAPGNGSLKQLRSAARTRASANTSQSVFINVVLWIGGRVVVDENARAAGAAGSARREVEIPGVRIGHDDASFAVQGGLVTALELKTVALTVLELKAAMGPSAGSGATA